MEKEKKKKDSRMVSIVFNSTDASQWQEYLNGQIADDTINAETFFVTDSDLFNGLNHRAESHMLSSKVVLVLMTPEHVKFLQQSPRANYSKIFQNGEKGILFLLGIDESEIDGTVLAKKFPELAQWKKVSFGDTGDGIKKLLLIIMDLLEKPPRLCCNFNVYPSTLHCGDTSTVVMTTDEPVPEDTKLKAVVRSNEVSRIEIETTRLNPNTFKASMPELTQEQQMSVTLEANGKSLGSHVIVEYKSYITADDCAAVNTIYCQCLDVMCKLLKDKNRFGRNNESSEVDTKLSEIFHHTVDLPIKGFEFIFGIYHSFTEETGRSLFPTLVHVAAKYNLKETIAALVELPEFGTVCGIKNKDGKLPSQVACENKHDELGEFLNNYYEQMEIYTGIVSYVQGQQGDPGKYYNTKDKGGGEGVDVIESYGDMSFPGPNPGKPSASHPDDPTENYMDMTGRASFKKKPVKEEVGEDYEGVEDWTASDAGYNPGTPQSTKPAPPSSTRPPRLKGAGSDAPETAAVELPAIQTSEDLKRIMEQVKQGELSIEQADKSFKDWMNKQDSQSGNGKSFDEKQAQIKKSGAVLSKVVPNFLKNKTTKKEKVSRRNTERKTPGRGQLDHKPSISKPSPRLEAKPKATPLASGAPQKTGESLYVGREPVAPPAPPRPHVKPTEPKLPPRNPVITEEEPREMYLPLGKSEDDDFYDYAEENEWTGRSSQATHNFPLPSVPSDNMYLDRSSTASSTRLSNISSGSRSSSLSTSSSGRESTVSHSSGIEEDIDMRSAKRQSIHDRELPDPPCIPQRSRRPPPPTPETPDTPGFDQQESSFPLEAPPPVPSHASAPLESVQEVQEEPKVEESEEDTRAKFLAKIGAVPMHLGMQMPRPASPSGTQLRPTLPKKPYASNKPKWPPSN